MLYLGQSVTACVCLPAFYMFFVLQQNPVLHLLAVYNLTIVIPTSFTILRRSCS